MSTSEHPQQHTQDPLLEDYPVPSRSERFTKDAESDSMFRQRFVTSLLDEKNQTKILSNPLWGYEYILDWYDGPLSFSVIHPLTNVRLLGVNWDDSLAVSDVSKHLFVEVSEEEFISFRSGKGTFRDFFFSGRPLLLVEHFWHENRLRQSPYSTNQLMTELRDAIYDSEGVLAIPWEVPFWSMYENEQSRA